MTTKILIGPSKFAAFDTTPLDILKEKGLEVVMNPYGRKLTKPELKELLPGVTGLVAGLEPLDKEILSHSSLQVVSRCGSGTSNVDLAVAEERGIVVKTTPEAPVNSVAEITIGMMITVCRMAYEMNQRLHSTEWHKLTGFELKGKTIAIMGYGRIGRRVSELLAPFKANLVVVDPFLTTPPPSAQVLSLSEALPIADIVTFHASGEEELLGEKQMSSLKKGVVLLNPARGGLINEQALIRALENGTVATAWLDTFNEEPYSGPLIKFPQAILTPHIGSYSRECRREMEMQAVTNLLEALN